MKAILEKAPATPAMQVAASSGSMGAYQGASFTKELSTWAPWGGSADSDLLPDLDTLRSRTRDLTRNNGIAGGSIQTILDNVVGTGPRLSSTPDYRMLGRNKDWSEEWSQNTEALWRQVSETTELDAAGCLSVAGMTVQAFRAALFNGEALALPLWLPSDRSKWSTRFQLVEADRLSNPFGRTDGEKVPGGELRGGVEQDLYGRPLAFHIRTTHPGDLYGLSVINHGDWDRIPAETPWGRPRVLHLHDKERTGQTRGKPLLSAVLPQFKMLDHYQRTELQAAVVNALVAAVIETPLPPEAVAEMVGADPTDARYQQYLADQRKYIAPLRGGAIITPPPGTKLSSFLPNRPADAFGPFVEAVTRHIGAGIGLPLELLLKDFSKTNYSSARAALLEAWRFFLGRRKWIEQLWLGRIYALWLEEAVSLGLIDAPDFYQQQYAYCRCRWIWPGRGWIDPVKEAEAANIRIESGLSTLEDECAEQGKDWEEVMEQRARERAVEMEHERRLGAPLFKPQPPKPTPAVQPVEEPAAA